MPGGVAGCVKKTRKRQAVRKMKVGPSKSSCRRGLQTAVSCFSQKLRWGACTVKRRDRRARHVGIRETNANEPPTTHRNTTSDDIRTGTACQGREEHGGHLLTGRAMSGVQGA